MVRTTAFQAVNRGSIPLRATVIILAIETSCDDTSVAIVKINDKNRKFEILANLISSQINIHKKWGGVVPNLASRAHAKNLPIVFKAALKEAQLNVENIDAIALTVGPGLSPSLLIGVSFGRALAYKYNKPIIPINHVEGHLYSNFLSENGELKNIAFPVMNLIVSGGHTSLYLMKKHGQYELIGKTRDDAAGEAFDKAAKMLGLGYPGGPIISQLAEKFEKSKHQNIKTSFPRPMINSKDFDFSFSGLKTAIFYSLKELINTPSFTISSAQGLENSKEVSEGKRKITKDIKIAYCHETQEAIIDVLISKTISAAKKFGVKTIAISGGVSANNRLRERFATSAKENNFELHIPPKHMSTDNGLMIAIAGYYNWLADHKTTWDKTDINPNLKL